MATSDRLAGAPSCQFAMAETPLKADPRTSGETYYAAPYYNTCRAHQENQARNSTRRPPLWNRKDIPWRSTLRLTMKNVLAD